MSADPKEVAEEYRSSLRDLVNNSKPLITMLTMLAEENRSQASVIVKVIEEHIHEVQVPGAQKLPVMYLIDSIMKNVGTQYIKLFAYNIISTFCCVFEKVDERTRKKLYELRTTWNEVFPKSRLYGLDVKVQAIDPAWPLPSVMPSGAGTQPTPSKPNIHINPNIIKPGGVKATSLSTSSSQKNQKDMEILKLKREEELLSLEKKKLMLEKKKILLQQNRHPKGDETEKSVNEDPSISSERRSQFLRSYKIKKRSQGEEESKVPNIHLDPRRVHQVLPLVTATSPSPLAQSDPRSRGQEATSRDPRLAQEQRASGGEASRDPRRSGEVSRDPRLASHPTEQVKASRDPRLAGKDFKDKKDKEKDKEKEKEKDKERKEKEEKKKEKEHHRSSSKKESSSSLSFSSSSTTRDSKKKKDGGKSSSKSSSSSSKSSHHEKDSIITTPITTTTAITTGSTTTLTASSTSSSSPSPSSSSSKESKKSALTPESSEGPATFKNDRRSRQRTYKKREESPDEASEPQSKRSRGEVTSDSDSDHYDANRPSPALYNKPGEYESWVGWAWLRGLLAGLLLTSSCPHSCLRPHPALASVWLSAF